MKTTDSYTAATGIVTKINYPSVSVRIDGQDVRCNLPARDRQSKQREGVPIVGDLVEIQLHQNGNDQIVRTLPRRNTLSRRSAVPMPTAHAHEQAIAANVDLLVPVFAAANPAPHWGLLDRYLALAELEEIPVLICLTKSDLAVDENGGLPPELANVLEEYHRIGYPNLITSAQSGEGIDALRCALEGKQAVFLGKSGVGKTSLLNELQPGLGQRVNEVNRVTGKGRHTTTQSEAFPLDSGGMIIDTPGIREFGLWEVPADELAYLFPEIGLFVGKCRFGLGCRHVDEPGCAVRMAVMSGEVSPYRYQSYIKLLDEAV